MKGDDNETFYDTKGCPLQRWLPSIVLGKTLNYPLRFTTKWYKYPYYQIFK